MIQAIITVLITIFGAGLVYYFFNDTTVAVYNQISGSFASYFTESEWTFAMGVQYWYPLLGILIPCFIYILIHSIRRREDATPL